MGYPMNTLQFRTPTPITSQIGTLLALGFLSGLMSGCLLSTKKSTRSRGASELIVRDSIYLDRIADGAAGRLQFKTSRSAVCEIAFYSQEPNVAPTKEKPVTVPCSGEDKPRQEFTERIENLASNTLYFVVISAWDPGAGKKAADVVTVREGAGNPSPGNPGSQDGAVRNIFVGRIDLPLKVAEVHKHTLAKPASLSDLKRALVRNEGCQVSVPNAPAPFREPTTDLGIANLASRDIATGSATQHKDYPQRVSLLFPSLNIGMDKWSIFYQENGRDVLIPARPIATFASVVMTSNQSYNFETPQLNEATDPFKIDPNQPLRFAWTSNSQLTTSTYVTVQIGRSNNQKSIYCLFAAEKRAGTIDPQLLVGLAPDKYVISVELVSNILIAKENWLVTSYDWRSARLEK